MSNKMEQSLDDILQASKTSRRGRGPRRSGVGRPAATAGPVGGVAKSTRQGKQVKAAPTAPAANLGGETKIMVSNLPLDIDERQLQEYFSSAVNVGRPKKVIVQYGPNGRSIGSAMVIFNKHDQAAKATTALDGVKIDGRLVRVELLVSASKLPAAARPISLADRVTQPKKDKPKPATAEKAAPGGARGRGQTRERGGRGRGGREPRPKKKTVEELDAEMADYFPGASGEASTAAIVADIAPATGGGDTAMDDEML